MKILGRLFCVPKPTERARNTRIDFRSLRAGFDLPFLIYSIKQLIFFYISKWGLVFTLK